jgi:hypothetical protein
MAKALLGERDIVVIEGRCGAVVILRDILYSGSRTTVTGDIGTTGAEDVGTS